MGSLRWAFKVGAWQPTKEQLLLAIRCVQPEERQRICKFVFQKDVKSALAGRLLLRKAIHSVLGIPYRDISLARTEKGKPYLLNHPPGAPPFSFNVSHQGDYAVLAAECTHEVGVDTMRMEYPRGSKTVEDFFKNMTRQFTNSEWQAIKEPFDELDQLRNFYRFWCLKESYVKTIGVGIGYSLQRLDFYPQSDLEPGSGVVSDTRLYIDGDLQKRWRFDEVILDDTHGTAVALQQVGENALPEPTTFTHLTFEELMEGAEPLTDPEPTDWQQFSAKPLHPGAQ